MRAMHGALLVARFRQQGISENIHRKGDRRRVAHLSRHVLVSGERRLDHGFARIPLLKKRWKPMRRHSSVQWPWRRDHRPAAFVHKLTHQSGGSLGCRMWIKPPATADKQNDNAGPPQSVGQCRRVQTQVRVVRDALNVSSLGENASVRSHDRDLAFSERLGDFVQGYKSEPTFGKRIFQALSYGDQSRVPVCRRLRGNPCGSPRSRPFL